MSLYHNAPELQGLSLGKNSTYPTRYDASQLQAVPRSLNRDDIHIHADSLPFQGSDDWTGYEISWLNSKGKPCVAIGLFRFPCQSPHLVESKSFKLYLNSFNQTRFGHPSEVERLMQRDLSACAGAQIRVQLFLPNEFHLLPLQSLDGICIDELDIEISDYSFRPAWLEGAAKGEQVKETLVSHLLKSNCLITGQPDWASLQIRYQGARIEQEALLRYLISFRQHNEFHEQCVERIFTDVLQYCRPDKLTVQARYTRRGGLDINPFRSNFESAPPPFRMARQ